MNMRAMTLTILILTSISNICFSQDGLIEELTWKECVEEAVSNHPDLVSARRLSENGIFEKMGVENKQLTTQKFVKKLFSDSLLERS